MNHKRSVAWPAPAKLNLFLHVNGKRSDGYHELQTLFQFIDHCDYLDFTINLTGNLRLKSNIETNIAAQDNIVIKAAMALQQATQTEFGAQINLDKRLPIGGGIGGGSSDAATTLVALNHLWGTGLSLDELTKIGVKLGADVPIFINGFSALAEGIGEQLHAVDAPENWYLILTPAVQISTARIFKHPLLHRHTPKLPLAELMKSQWRNDCQSVVIDHYPEVAKALAWLVEYAPARLTGTGACVFATVDSHQQAEQIFAELPASFCGFIAKGINKSPLALKLASAKNHGG